MKYTIKSALFIFLAVMCFSHIHQGTLAADAVRYARISMEIVQTGSLALFDHYSETPYVNKPPLLFWLTAGFFKVFGFSTFVAKIPAVFFTFIGMLAISTIAAQHNKLIGVLAVLTLVISPNFSRNMLAFSFEGIVTLGTALWLIGLISWSERQSRSAALALMTSCILIAQSKPPYFGLLLPAALPFIYSNYRKTKLPFFGLLAGLTIGGSWYLFQGADYLNGFAANQVGVTLTHRYPYYENLLRWLLSIVKNYALVAIPGGFFICKNIKTWRELPLNQQILLAHALIIIPVVLFIAIRPRYAIVPMTAMAPLAGIQLMMWFPKLSERVLKDTLTAATTVVLILVVSGIKLHPSHEFVDYLRQNPTSPDKIEFCQSGPTAERAAGKAKMNALLLELEFGQKYSLFSAYEEHPEKPGVYIYKDKGCRNFSGTKKTSSAANETRMEIEGEE